MDALTLDVAAAAACTAFGMAMLTRKRTSVRAPSPPRVPIGRFMRHLRRRHRRAVRAIVELAHECLERHPDGSFETFTAQEALRTYLPETLLAYFAVPRALRRAGSGGGPSADDELSRQLRTLQRGLERIRAADAAAGAARMAANGTFLNERFASTPVARLPDRRSVVSEFVDVLETALHRI
jgi:hypothetical protein